MKKRFFVFVGLLIWSQSIQSQMRFYFGKPDFSNSTVLLNDGKILVGEVQDFSSPNTVEFSGGMAMSASEGFESNFNFDRKKIKFRKSKTDSFRFIPSDSIDIIHFFDEELNKTVEYKRLKIVKSINGKITETKRTIFLPVFKKDAINLYGYHVYMNGRYATTIFYLNNPKDNIAINPYDLSIVEVLAARKKSKERVISCYKFVSENCQSFHKWLDEEFINEELEETNKQYIKTWKEERKEGKKKLKTKEEKTEFEKQKWTEFYMNTFTPAIEKYKQFCK